jgi:hypothetical protein
MRRRAERRDGPCDLDADEKRALRLLHASVAKGSSKAA